MGRYLSMFKIFRKFGPVLFFIIQPIILISVIALSSFGLISSQVALLLFSAISLEAIYIAFFIRARLNKAVNRLEDMESKVLGMRENEMDVSRMQRELIYAGHKIKTLQMDLYALKKTGSIKLSGNGHRRAHSPTVSHS